MEPGFKSPRTTWSPEQAGAIFAQIIWREIDSPRARRRREQLSDWMHGEPVEDESVPDEGRSSTHCE
jgi:hypothetical protein